MTDFKIGPLGLTISGYANDPSGDFYADNWLQIAVSCTTDQGDVAFQSPCLMTTDIFDFMDEINALLAGEGRQAYLVSLEPQIDLRIARGDDAGKFTLDVELTPDVDDDEDIYDLSVMVTNADVEAIVAQATQVVEAFPVRGIEGA